MAEIEFEEVSIKPEKKKEKITSRVQDIKIISELKISDDLKSTIHYYINMVLIFSIASIAYELTLPFAMYLSGFILQVILNYLISLSEPLFIFGFLVTFAFLSIIVTAIWGILFAVLVLVATIMINQSLNIKVPRTPLQKYSVPLAGIIAFGYFLITFTLQEISRLLAISIIFPDIVIVSIVGNENLWVSVWRSTYQESILSIRYVFIPLLYSIIPMMAIDLLFYVYRRRKKIKIVATKIAKVKFYTQEEYEWKKSMAEMGLKLTEELKTLILFVIFIICFIAVNHPLLYAPLWRI